MFEKQRTLRIMAARLREKLRRSVPIDILENMTDAELISEWHWYEAQRCKMAKVAEQQQNKEVKNILKKCLTMYA